MHRILSIISLLLMVVLFSCTSSKKMLEQRQYDSAVAKSAQALMKKPNDQKEFDVFSQAFALANEEDNERIKFLKQSNEPQVWEEIFDRYNRLKYRETLVKPLHQSIKQRINFVYIDYDQDIINAKQKAADFLYQEGNNFLSKNNRFDARNAYDRFSRVKSYLPAYTGIDEKINQAYSMSFSYILYKVKNGSNRSLPAACSDELLKIGLGDQEYRWLSFYTHVDNSIKYDYSIVLNIRSIDASPELSTSTQSVESKDVEDGWEYVLGTDGKVQKDSLGNELKKTKYKTITCSVTRFSLGKSATIAGSLDFIDNSTGQIIKSDPVSASYKYEFVYAKINGDKNALSEETLKLTTLKIALPPSNDELFQKAAEDLKIQTKERIHANVQLLQ